MTATGMVFGVGLGTAHALIDEHKEIKKAKKAQFYFLYATDQMLGMT